MIQLEAPIFLNVEFSRSFVQEYPICAKEKNIVMPYPSIDPELLRGSLVPSSLKQISLSEEVRMKRFAFKERMRLKLFMNGLECLLRTH
jgi:hypothetical protein